MADSEQIDSQAIRSSPAKSVDSKVAPDFCAGIVAELELHYKDIDEFCERLHDKITPTTKEDLKADTLKHTIDSHAREIISNTSFVEALSTLSQLCRECEDAIYSEKRFDRLSLQYKVYNTIAHRIPTIVRDALIKRCKTSDCQMEMGEDNDGADGVLIEGKYNLTPYKICTQYGTLMRRIPKTHKTISEVICTAYGYPEDVKKYLLGEVDVWLAEGLEDTLWDSQSE